MRVFLAGATGVIGTPLVPQLLEAGHEVTAMTRSVMRAVQLEAAGADPVVCDVFDAERVRAAMADASPDVVIHQLTSLPPRLDWANPNVFDQNNRVRTEGTRVLVDAALATGARRVVAQSIAFAYAPMGDRVKEEDAALATDAPPPFGGVVAAVVEHRAAGHGHRGDRRARAALRHALRPRHLLRPARLHGGRHHRRSCAARRGRHRHVQLAARRGCRVGGRRGARAGRAGDLQRRRRRAGAAARVAARPCAGAGRRSARGGGDGAAARTPWRCRCAAPPTRRPSASSDGGRGTRAGAKASPQASPERSLLKRGELLLEASHRVRSAATVPSSPGPRRARPARGAMGPAAGAPRSPGRGPPT